MLYQLHHQKLMDLEVTRMVAQREFDPETATHSDVREWCEDVAERHICPPECMWLMCDETSDYFERAANPNGMETNQ